MSPCTHTLQGQSSWTAVTKLQYFVAAVEVSRPSLVWKRLATWPGPIGMCHVDNLSKMLVRWGRTAYRCVYSTSTNCNKLPKRLWMKCLNGFNVRGRLKSMGDGIWTLRANILHCRVWRGKECQLQTPEIVVLATNLPRRKLGFMHLSFLN